MDAKRPNKVRILWLSNGRRSPTGYGNQTDLFTPLLHHHHNYHCDIFAFYGQEGSPTIDQDGILTLPRVLDAYGNDVVRGHFGYRQSDVVVSLIDPFVLNPDIVGELPWVAWAPVDTSPVRPGNVAVLKRAKQVWAMSRFGEARLKEAGLENVAYVPHGVDMQAFQPYSKETARAEAARMLKRNLGSRFVVFMNAANKGYPSRKGFMYAFEAFKRLGERWSEHGFEPEDRPLLWLHTEEKGIYQGENLIEALEMAGIAPEDYVFSPQYPYVTGMFGPEHLNMMYNAADVLLCTSLGEGFCIPLIEAQAAGCPTIAPEWSATEELANYLIEPAGPMFMGDGTQMMIPDIESIVTALLEVADENPDPDAMRVRVGAYERHHVFSRYMLPALETLAQRLGLRETGNVASEVG